MNPLFRQSFSIIALVSSKRALTSILQRDSLRVLSSSTPLQHHHHQDTQTSYLQRRFLHSGGFPLGFHFTDRVSAQHAVDEYACDEKKPRKNDENQGLEISALGIADVIVKELAKKGITSLFPIQKAVLEPAMEGRDMIGRAKTGTGKTLAFGIPIMDKIIKFNAKHGRGRNPLALVLAPTRELARQVEKEFRDSSDLDTLCVYGGSPINQQMSSLDYGVDVVVGTPGRVIDLIKRGALNLSEVQFLVLDEADQMLAVGFAEDVEVILEKLPRKRQSMMFSATMPSWIKQLTRKHLNDPLTIDLVGDSDQKLAEGISLFSISSDNYGKPSIIGSLVAEYAKGGKCIVFTQTKRDADRLAYSLGRSLKCEPLHGDISQAQRERTLGGFRDARFNVLVATDVAARGLDVPNVDLVIHYELPSSSEIFVHRSGRTGRAGKKGIAILIHSDHQTREVRTIEQHVGCRFKELPKIKVESGAGSDMFGDMGGAGRFGSYDGSRSSSRSGSYGGSSSGRSGGFGGSSGGFGGSSGGFGGSSGGYGSRSGGSGFGSSGFGGRSGGSSRSGGFGESRSSEGGFGDSGRSRGGFGDSGRSRGGFGDSGRSRGGFGDSGKSGSNRFGGSSSSRFSFDD